MKTDYRDGEVRKATVGGRDVRVVRGVLDSGAVLLSVWERWPGSVSLPRGCDAAYRDGVGNWWMSVSQKEARVAIGIAFPESEIRPRWKRWTAFEEIQRRETA